MIGSKHVVNSIPWQLSFVVASFFFVNTIIKKLKNIVHMLLYTVIKHTEINRSTDKRDKINFYIPNMSLLVIHLFVSFHCCFQLPSFKKIKMVRFSRQHCCLVPLVLARQPQLFWSARNWVIAMWKWMQAIPGTKSVWTNMCLNYCPTKV